MNDIVICEESTFPNNRYAFTYKFAPHGKSFSGQGDENEIVLDVGGVNEGLIFDHHFPNCTAPCAAFLVFESHQNRLEEFKQNLESKQLTRVRIVVHQAPDFDCACSAWLVKRYLEDGAFPSGAGSVVSYAADVDTGILRITRDNYLVPASAMTAFYEIAQQMIIRNELNVAEKNCWILERAFTLMDWCAENLPINRDSDARISDSEIFARMAGAPLFAQEYALLREDRALFDLEVNDPKICRKIDDFKLLLRDSNETGSVKALIYYIPPMSALTKYWARGENYVFTFIPQRCDTSWEKAVWRPGGFTGDPTRVIISVDPRPEDATSPFTLLPMAIQLETAECEFERRILGDAAELKRTRAVIRNGYENKNWVTNADPWYDGSSHDHTIVDAPSSYSLLPMVEIIRIAESYTEKDINRLHINLICPVSMVEGKGRAASLSSLFDGNIRSRQSVGQWQHARMDDEDGDMLAYTKQSLNIRNDMHVRTRWYEKHTELVFTQHAGGIGVAHSNQTMVWNGASHQIDSIRLVCFPSNQGFLILSADFGAVRSTSEVPGILRLMQEQCVNDFSCLFDGEQSEAIVFGEPVFMVHEEFNQGKMRYLDIGSQAFRTSAFLDEALPLSDGCNERSFMEGKLLRINAGAVFGFSRNCTVLCTTGGRTGVDTPLLKAFRNRFSRQWLFEWLLAMHQHNVIVDMKKQLGTPKIHKSRTLSHLRSDFVDFRANYCFTQVAADTTGAELYHRWRDILMLDAISDEVNEQLEALDENNRTSFESRVTVISYLFLPISIVLSILQVFPFLNNNEASLDMLVLRLFAVMCISLLLPFLSIHVIRMNEKRRRKRPR